MENASKALIIAGAILLAILIIGLGMFIYQQAAGVMQGINMSQEEIQAFNAKFDQYEGNNVRGANVNALLNQIVNNNLSTDDDSRKIKVTPSGTPAIEVSTDANGKATKITTKALTGRTYKVEFVKDASSALINEVKITINSAT